MESNNENAPQNPPETSPDSSEDSQDTTSRLQSFITPARLVPYHTIGAYVSLPLSQVIVEDIPGLSPLNFLTNYYNLNLRVWTPLGQPVLHPSQVISPLVVRNSPHFGPAPSIMAKGATFKRNSFLRMSIFKNMFGVYDDLREVLCTQPRTIHTFRYLAFRIGKEIHHANGCRRNHPLCCSTRPILG